MNSSYSISKSPWLQKIILISIFLLTSLVSAFAQTSQPGEAMLCGKAGGNYLPAELANCDMQILPVDKNLTVVEFKITLMKEGGQQTEEAIKGNTIPKAYKDKILSPEYRNFMVEYIKAIDKNGNAAFINPLMVRIKKSE